jgi:Luciferase-like monooxygenase
MLISLTVPNNQRVKTLLQPWQDEVGGPQIAEVAALADRLGFSRLTVAEHFAIPADHGLSGPHHLHAVTSLAYLAGITSRIRLASNVSILPLQDPVVQAKQWAVLDWLSGGRADLMAGVGWLKEEFDILGVDFTTRGRLLDECVEVMRRIWTSDLASYDGEFYRFHEIAAERSPGSQEGSRSGSRATCRRRSRGSPAGARAGRPTCSRRRGSPRASTASGRTPATTVSTSGSSTTSPTCASVRATSARPTTTTSTPGTRSG